MRETSTSGDSEVRSLSQKLGVSVGESRSASLEATRVEETFQRVSNDVRESSARGWSLNRNESQEFVVYAQERLLGDDTLSQFGWTPGMVMPRTPQQEQVRDILLGEFMNAGGIGRRLMALTLALLPQLRGGLAYVNLGANMMMASILVEAWDLYSIAFVLIFI